MKRIVISMIALVACGVAAMAADVPQTATRQAAFAFWNTYRPVDVKPLADASALTALPYGDYPHLAVYAVGTQGFVVVAADDRVQPVLAYSFDSPMPEQPHASLRYWLGGYEGQIADAVRRDVEPASWITRSWSQLLDSIVPTEPVSIGFIPALCSTRWNQSDMTNTYNRLCPFDSNYFARTVVGCVATAMAQIMKYWNHPSCGVGSHTYVHHNWRGGMSYGTLSADFANTTYLWSYMPISLQTFSTEAEVNAVATLSYHCGVAVDMMYGPSATGGSGAYVLAWDSAAPCAENAFWKYFKYNPDLHGEVRAEHDSAAWAALIEADLEAGRPIYYDGDDSTGGHAFILDGADLHNRYHFNLGWGGYGDGFYSINNIAPGSGGDGGNATYTFNENQEAIFNIFPVPEQFDTVVYTDTICTNYDIYDFYEYQLPVSDDTLYLTHLDTVFLLQLSVMPKKYLYLDPHGAEGSRRSQAFCPADDLVVPDCPFQREGYVFRCWNTRENGSGVSYNPGQVVRLASTTAFYAQWRDASDTVGIDLVDPDAVRLRPNPATATLLVGLPVASADLFLYDAFGRLVRRQQAVGGEAQIDVADLASGLYTLQVRTADAVINRRIIKR